MHIDASREFVRELRGGRPKGYFEAHITKESRLSIDAHVEDQPW
jgi:hypothetical protein